MVTAGGFGTIVQLQEARYTHGSQGHANVSDPFLPLLLCTSPLQAGSYSFGSYIALWRWQGAGAGHNTLGIPGGYSAVGGEAVGRIQLWKDECHQQGGDADVVAQRHLIGWPYILETVREGGYSEQVAGSIWLLA